MPGGWLLLVHERNEAAISFYPDAEHLWDGNSMNGE